MDHTRHTLFTTLVKLVRRPALLHGLNEELVNQLPLLDFLLPSSPFPNFLELGFGVVGFRAFGDGVLACKGRLPCLERVVTQITLGLTDWLGYFLVDNVEYGVIRRCPSSCRQLVLPIPRPG